MPEEPQIPVTFVKVGKDGQVERTHQFEPWPPTPAISLPPPIFVSGPHTEGDEPSPELRHLSYDDPPRLMTEETWRAMLAAGVGKARDRDHFVSSLTAVLAKDLVESHGCDPEVAIPPIMEFAINVYREFTEPA